MNLSLRWRGEFNASGCLQPREKDWLGCMNWPLRPRPEAARLRDQPTIQHRVMQSRNRSKTLWNFERRVSNPAFMLLSFETSLSRRPSHPLPSGRPTRRHDKTPISSVSNEEAFSRLRELAPHQEAGSRNLGKAFLRDSVGLGVAT